MARRCKPGFPCQNRQDVSGTVLILASASPRRAELLMAAGLAFEVAPADVDERLGPSEDAGTYVRRLSVDKARATAERVPNRAVLGADTVVVIDHHILGKPDGTVDARRMLRILSGRTHQVLTAVTLIPTGSARIDTQVARTEVEFAHLDDAEIDWYVGTGEPLDKAGAYAIQGLASRFVTRISGSYTNVVGLPVALVYQMCTRAGLLLS